MIFNIEDSIYREANSTPLTPEDVACDMIQLVRDTGFFDEVPEGTDLVKWAECHRVCDIYCKSGVFLMICFWLFMRSLMVVIDDFEARKKFVIDNLLYGFSPNFGVCRLLRLDLYGDANRLGHIYELSVRNEIKVKEIFGDMKFDVVVGNPPYDGKQGNVDLYEVFVQKALDLSCAYVLMITPSKWCSRPNSVLSRQLIMKYARKIIRFVTSYEVFDSITQWGGLSILFLDKLSQPHLVSVQTVSSLVEAFNGTYLESRDKNMYCLDYFGETHFIPRLGNYEIFRSRYNQCDSHFYHVPNTWSYTGFLECRNNYAFVLSPTSVNTDSLFHKNDMIIFSGTETECNSVMSYFESKFVKFGLFLGMNIQHPFHRGSDLVETNKNALRYVPNISILDCIYEDRPVEGYTPDEGGEYIDTSGNKHCSLYVKYKLTDEEINVIESVIRSRG